MRKKPNSIDVVTEKMEYHSTVDVAALKNKIVREGIEYQRKLELGKKIKEIVLELNIPTASLDKDKMEALELLENCGHVKEIKAVEWRPWQKKILEYLNNPTHRRVIWVVGEKENEGKTFFQDKIEEEYGMNRVCTMSLTESSRNFLHYM